MTTETHTLNLAIDASTGQKASRDFTAALNAVKRAVSELDRDSTGLFTKLRSGRIELDVTPLTRATSESQKLATGLTATMGASDRAAENIRRLAITSANAMRISTDQASRLQERLISVGDSNGLARLEMGLSNLRSSLIAATSGLDIREARAGYADLASELNRSARSAEILRSAANAETTAMEGAARAAATHASQLEASRARYDSVFAGSRQYERALSEIQALEDAGAMSAVRASQAREQAAVSILGAATAQDRFNTSAKGFQTANLAAQVQDVFVSWQMGLPIMSTAIAQGLQASTVLTTLGSRAAIVSGLGGAFMSLLNPVTLVTVGVIALGGAIVAWMTSGGEETKSFADALGEANSSITAMRQATDTLAGSTLGSLATGYGRVNAELQIHLEKLQQIAQIEATRATTDAMNAVGGDYMGGWLTTDVDDMRIAFDTTNDAARNLLGMLNQIKSARTFDEQFSAVQKMRQEVESVTGGLGSATGGAQAFLVQLLRAEDAGLRLKAAQDGTTNSTNNASGAASGLAYTIGTAADEAARLLSLLNGVPGALAVMGKSVEGQIAGIRAQNRALNLELSEGLSGAAANRRVQLEDMVKTGGERGQRLNFDQIAGEWAKIGELDAAAKETERLRTAISDKNKPAKSGGGKGGGGGRTAALSEEQKAVEDLNDTLTERLTSLEAERVTLALVASGQFKTTEAAELFAKAMVQGGGAVDAQTTAMISQIDVAAKLNEELTKAAKDPVKEWMDSVPGWIEAGKQIEMGAITSVRDAISEMIKTGTFDIKALGEAILGTIADVMADKATKELLNLLGRDKTGPMGWLGGLMGDSFASKGDTDLAAMASGSMAAGQNIGGAMIAAGNQVSAQLRAAMTGAGAQAGAAVRAGGQQGLALGANNIRMAAATGGSTLGQGVVQGAQVGAPILAQGVASGAGGGGGGGLLAGVGGWGGLLSMAIGAFSEGGYSTSPVGSAMVPIGTFRNAPHYAEGTANTSGIPAILHPSEAVVPLSKGRKIQVELGDSAGGSTTVNHFTWNVSTPNPDAFRKSQNQIAADAARMGQRSLGKNG